VCVCGVQYFVPSCNVEPGNAPAECVLVPRLMTMCRVYAHVYVQVLLHLHSVGARPENILDMDDVRGPNGARLASLGTGLRSNSDPRQAHDGVCLVSCAINLWIIVFGLWHGKKSFSFGPVDTLSQPLAC